LAASVAHEINNPVAGVLNLSMLMKRLVKEDGVPHARLDEFRGYLDDVVSETSRVGRIVSDLLAFSRRPSPHREPADLNEIIRRTVSLLDHKLELAAVRLDLALAEGIPAVMCDASQIQQVVVNLVSNGVEATQSGGTVSVRTASLESGGAVAFEVSDTGSGIPEEMLTRIFDPFFTTKEEGQGTGLGLAVSYGIVVAHGGEIEVESRVGVGTTFRVILPLSRGANGQTTRSNRAPGGDVSRGGLWRL
jgi:signal transduction histidine kinase